MKKTARGAVGLVRQKGNWRAYSMVDLELNAPGNVVKVLIFIQHRGGFRGTFEISRCKATFVYEVVTEEGIPPMADSL